MPKDWKGDIVFSDNVAVFRGPVGENKAHSHWASQITIALDGSVEFKAADGVKNADAVYFASKTEHSLISGFVCSIYFDPLFDSMLKVYDGQTKGGCACLSRDELPEIFSSITPDSDLRDVVNSLPRAGVDDRNKSDHRFETVLQAIKTNLGSDSDIDRDALAALVNLSPTRFSHWFVEQTGIPLRSFKKWLKLRMAMDAMLEGGSPMSAAMQAGFSDLAHMSREFSDSFGLTYRDAQRALQYSKEK